MSLCHKNVRVSNVQTFSEILKIAKTTNKKSCKNNLTNTLIWFDFVNLRFVKFKFD